MQKRSPRKAKALLWVLGVPAVLAVAAGLLARHGRIRITVENDLPESVRVVSVQRQSVGKEVASHGTGRFTYRIAPGDATVSLRLQVGDETVDREIVDYVDRAYYGRVTVKVSRDEAGEPRIEADANVGL
jgi:hypothetical protein